MNSGLFRFLIVTLAVGALASSGCSDSDDSSSAVPRCDDGVMNGSETGVDCGGICAACIIMSTCSDGLQNGDETGVDCGGSCAACTTTPSCSDNTQNGDETGVDCGGSCAPCTATPTCSDNTQNGDETDIDCGGSCGVKCSLGDGCDTVTDCAQGDCLNMICDELPTVVSVTPSMGAAFVDPDSDVVITFSEPVDPASVDRFSLSVNVDGTTDGSAPGLPSLDGTWSTSGNTATFSPSVPFEDKATVYAVQLNGCDTCSAAEILDMNGNALVGAQTWTFTTLPVRPGELRLASTVGANHRLTTGPNMNAIVVQDVAGELLRLRHIGSGDYTLEIAGTNNKLTMSTGLGGTDWTGGNAVNALFGSSQAILEFRYSGTSTSAGDIFYIDSGSYSVRRVCPPPGGFCTNGNLEFVQGAVSEDGFYVIR